MPCSRGPYRIFHLRARVGACENTSICPGGERAGFIGVVETVVARSAMSDWRGIRDDSAL